MSEHVKMKTDKEDPQWEWLKPKLIKMKKAKLNAASKSKDEREAEEKRKASKLEEGAMVCNRPVFSFCSR